MKSIENKTMMKIILIVLVLLFPYMGNSQTLQGERLTLSLSGEEHSNIASFSSRNPEAPYVSWYHNINNEVPVRYGYIQVGKFSENHKLFLFTTQNGANFNFRGGNVGINNAFPSYLLDVAGRVNATEYLINGVPLQPSLWSHSSENIHFTNGKVGIGTSNFSKEGFQLYVKEGVLAEKIVVKLESAWGDYVFEPEYKLKPLSEVETYIKAHKHLPEIPSASEIEKNGVNLGEMDAAMMKKIEELTLYMIELKKENDALKQRVEELEKKD
ncbi:hypothetical protein AAG747_28605 [Rapidithrix thailandica]|uniref:Uncharacterized protein n=1 Tax=Rapidithrix thailandica TaxID=413964 RepID=A0AAW9S3Z3_9BACT